MATPNYPALFCVAMGLVALWAAIGPLYPYLRWGTPSRKHWYRRDRS
jgi:hypothetical protein